MSDQTRGMTGAAADAIELLTSDHREVEQLFTQFEHAAADSKIAKEVADKIVRELSVHAVIEEEILYPALKDLGEAANGLREHSLDEHQDVKKLLASVDGKPADDPKVRQTFQKVKASVQEHVAEEEGKVFPFMKTKCGQEKLMQMGEAMAKAKKTAPTHPHPHAPNTPPGNVVAGMGAMVVDKIRDAARSAMKR